MSLSVCLLLDPTADRAVRRLWQRLEDAGVSTLMSHTHGRHVPHLTFAPLRGYDLDAVRSALSALPAAEPTTLHLDALGMFRRSRCWLMPAVTSELVARQEAAVQAALSTGADLHPYYRPGAWLPHLSLAPRLQLEQLTTVAREVYGVLPLTATVSRAALVDTSTGDVHDLPHLL